MNQKEARELAEVAKMLRFGPGGGWRELIGGDDRTAPWRTIDDRERSLKFWLDSWILSKLDRIGSRYVQPKRRSR